MINIAMNYVMNVYIYIYMNVLAIYFGDCGIFVINTTLILFARRVLHVFTIQKIYFTALINKLLGIYIYIRGTHFHDNDKIELAHYLATIILRETN